MPPSRQISLKNIIKTGVLYSRYQKTKRDEDVPLLFREPFIHTGYRATNNAWTYYLASLFQIHNETFNVWTHLIASVLFIYLTLSYKNELDYYSHERVWPLIGFGFGALCYSSCSSFAHLFQSQSELAHYTCFQIDYIGIGMNALGNSILCYHLIATDSFYYLVGPHFYKLNLVFSFFTCAGCAAAKLKYKRPYPLQRKVLQMFAVALQSVYGSLPVLHAIFECSITAECSLSSIAPYLHYLTWFLVSTVLYACHIPERFFPGWCDIVGYGHQLFHVTMAYTTYLQFRAAAWSIRRRPQHLYELSNPSFRNVFGYLLFVLVADAVFVYLTHTERIKRAEVASKDFELEMKQRHTYSIKESKKAR